MIGLYRDNGKQNGDYYVLIGFNWENGKENGNIHMHQSAGSCEPQSKLLVYPLVPLIVVP